MKSLFKSQAAYELLGLFARDPEKRYYLAELAKHLHRDVANVTRELPRLAAEQLIRSETDGGRKYYRFNLLHPIAQELRELFRKMTQGGLVDTFIADALPRNAFKILFEEININFFTWSNIMLAFHDPRIQNYCGDYLRSSLAEFRDDHGRAGYELSRWNELGRRVFSGIQEKRIDDHQLERGSLRFGAKLSNMLDHFERENLTTFPSTKLLKYLDDIWDLMHEITLLGFVPVISDFEHFTFSQALETIVQEKIHAHHLTRSSQDYVSVLSSPTRETNSFHEALGAVKIAQKVKPYLKQREKVTAEALQTIVRQYPGLRRLVRNHLDSYCWLNFYYQGPALDELTLLTRVADTLRKHKNLNRLENETKSHYQRLRAKQNIYLRELRLTKGERRLFNVARRFLFLKAYRVEIRERSNYAFDKIFRLLTERYPGLDVTDFRYSTVDEIHTLIASGSLPTTAGERKQRRSYSVFFMHDGHKGFLYGDEARAYMQSRLLQESLDTTINEIKGMVASAGKARGVARIVNSSADTTKVNHMDILVSISTSPELLPAMKKAGAFITDTGGITSHAAIVAREMHKPCIIGVKIATKVIHDGDLVEVDAEKGIVRILKRTT